MCCYLTHNKNLISLEFHQLFKSTRLVNVETPVEFIFPVTLPVILPVRIPVTLPVRSPVTLAATFPETVRIFDEGL